MHRSTSRSKAVGRPWGGEPEWEEGEEKPDLDPEKMFARGHTEQHMAITGTVTVGDETFDDHRRARAARPLVGAALLAEHLVVPLAHREPRARSSASRCTISGAEEDPDARRVGGFLYDVDRYGDDQWVPIRDCS